MDTKFTITQICFYMSEGFLCALLNKFSAKGIMEFCLLIAALAAIYLGIGFINEFMFFRVFHKTVIELFSIPSWLIIESYLGWGFSVLVLILSLSGAVFAKEIMKMEGHI